MGSSWSGWSRSPLAFVLLPHGWDPQAALLAFTGGVVGGWV